MAASVEYARMTRSADRLALANLWIPRAHLRGMQTCPASREMAESCSKSHPNFAAPREVGSPFQYILAVAWMIRDAECGSPQ